jgi:hypothetical protein
VSESRSLESLLESRRLPPVKADDLKRVWELMRRVKAEHGGQGVGVSIDVRFISQQCDPSADVIAVFFRVALLQSLLQAGLLDHWREANEPRALVFQVGATFPLDQCVQGFDPADFIDRLRSEEQSFI